MAPSLSRWATHVTATPESDNLVIYGHVTLVQKHAARETNGRKKWGIYQRIFIASRPSYYLLSTGSLGFAMAHKVIRNLNDTFKRLEAGESILVPVSPNGYPDLNRIHRTTTVIPSSAMVRAANQLRLSLPAPTIEEAPSSTTSEEEPLVSGNTTTADACGKGWPDKILAGFEGL